VRITAMQNGEAAGGGLADAYRQQRVALVKLAVFLVGDREAAEDLVQDSFLRVMERESEILDLESYLRATVVNRCRSLHRRRQLAGRRGTVASSETSEVDKIMLSEIRNALGRLTANQRAAIVLKYYCDLHDDEIGAALGLSSSTVRSTIARGLRRVNKEALL
jgi:RNA polymerase sigma factor (sigma-70 family)